MFEKGDLLKLNNGEEYILANRTILDEQEFLYLVSKDGVSSFKICELNDNNLIPVIDASMLERLLKVFRNL